MSNTLWEVKAENKNYGTLPDGNLLIIASSPQVAVKKAKRWLKKNKFTGYDIKKVEYNGTIDVF